MVGKESELKLKAFPTVKQAADWRRNSISRIIISAGRHDNLAKVWILQCLDPSISEQQLAEADEASTIFQSMTNRLATSCQEILTGDLAVETAAENDRLHRPGTSLHGRVIFRRILQQFAIGNEPAMLQAAELIGKCVVGGGITKVRAWLHSWDELVSIGGAAISEYCRIFY